MRIALLSLLVVLTLAIGCWHFPKVQRYYCCTDTTQCDEIIACDRWEDPSRLFCDMTGNLPGSGGLGRTCVAGPVGPDAMPRCDSPSDCSGATPACRVSTGQCVECIDESTCTTPQEPVCTESTNTCSGCTADADCTGRTDGRVNCNTATGVCELCVDNGDCSGSAPICDSSTKACRGCAVDAECAASGVCNTLDGDSGKGQCVAEDDVIYLSQGASMLNLFCTKAAPCNALQKGVDKLGLGSDGVTPRATRKWILIAAAVDTYAAGTTTIDDRVAILKGAGATAQSNVNNAAALVVSGTSNVTIEGLKLTAPLENGSPQTADAIRCADLGADTPTLRLVGVVLEGSKGQGLDANPCTLTMTRSTISGNTGGGIVATSNSSVTMTGCIVTGNTGGISLNTSNFDIVNNFVYANTSGAAGNFAGVKIDTLPAVPTKTRFQFNTVADNTGGGGTIPQLRCDTGGTELFLDNNIVAGDPLDGKQQFQGGQCKLRYSLVWKTSPPDGQVDVATTIRDMDPLFVGTGAKPVPFYRLATGSPARNTANPTLPGDAPTTDFDGDPRVGSGRADMGADETP